MTNQMNHTEQYDVFLSYRRDGGETMAILLRDRLTAKGYRVFLDVESLNSGSFNNRLLQVIDGCTDVIVVLSKGGLDRCANAGDWVRVEIAHALARGKNIVPVMLRGFEWPDILPGDIEALRIQNGVNASSNEYFDAVVDRLVDKFLLSRLQVKASPEKKNRVILACVVSLVVVAGLVFGGFMLFGNKDVPDNKYTPGVRESGNLDEGADTGTPVENPPDAPATTPQSQESSTLADEYFKDLPLSGNTTANIINGGIAAGDSTRIFFTDNDFSIYQFDPVAGTITKLYTETRKVNNLNYYRGRLYYSTSNAICSFDLKSGERNEILRVNAGSIFIEEDAIFYANGNDALKLYRLSLDGRVNTKLNDMTDIRHHTVSGGYFYYTDNAAGLKLFRSDLDGGNKIELTRFETRWPHVLGENVFCVEDPGSNMKIVRIDADGHNLEEVAQRSASCLNVTRDGYVYTNGEDRSSMYLLTFDGKTDVRLTDFPSRLMNVVGEWIFFTSREEDDAIYVMKTDGSEMQPIADFINNHPEGAPVQSGPSAGVSQETVTGRDYTVETSVYNMRITYSGGWANSRPNGEGVAIVAEDIPGRFNTGDILEGSWVNGLLEGPGVYTSGNYQLKGTFINGLKEGPVEQYLNGELIGVIEFINGSPAQ